MRRAGGLFARAFSFEALDAAFRRAARGKRDRPSTARFFRDLEEELLLLERELREGSWRPGPFEEFTLFDPKERRIAVPPFRDRVVHHAAIGALEPVLEGRFDYDSYGCRRGKGMDAALSRALGHARRFPFALKADVAKFFPSIDPGVVQGLLREIVKDRRFLEVIDRILDGHAPGLPIGSLTSQWLANLALTPLDRRLRELPGARAQVRYMDDVLVFGEGRRELREVLGGMRSFLADRLGLALKERATAIHRSRDGVPFLGFSVKPAGLFVRREAFRRSREGLWRAERLYRKGRLSLAGLRESAESRIAHLCRGRTLGLRRAFFARAPPVEW